MHQILGELKAKEAIKEAEAKRCEKPKDAKVRAAIEAQIEANKHERAAMAAREKALREGRAPDAPSSSTSASTASPSAAAPSPLAAARAALTGVAGRDYPTTRLQIRLADGGQPYTTLTSDAKVRELAECLAGQNLSVDVESVSFATQFRRKQFAQAGFEKKLRESGLTPSAVSTR